MDIVTLAPDEIARGLRAVSCAASVHTVSTVAQLSSALRGASACRVIIDPTPLSDQGYTTAIDSVVAAGFRLVLSAPREQFELRRLLEASERLLPELHLREKNDDARRLTALLRRDTESVSARVLAAVASRAACLDQSLRVATVGLFGGLPIPSRVGEFSRRMNVSVGSLRRGFASVGLARPHDLLDVARLCRAFDDFGRPALSLDDIATIHGFGSPRTLARRVRMLSGLPSRTAGRHCDSVEFAVRLSGAAMRN